MINWREPWEYLNAPYMGRVSDKKRKRTEQYNEKNKRQKTKQSKKRQRTNSLQQSNKKPRL